MELALTAVCFFAVSLGALFMAVWTYRHGGTQTDEADGVEYRFAARGFRASLTALAFVSVGLGGLLATALLLREAAGCRPKAVDEVETE